MILIPHFASLSCLSSVSIPRSYEEALLVPAWKQTIDDEMNVLISQWAWDLVCTPKGAVVVGCSWVYTLKNRPDESVNRYKVRLVAKGYTQTYRCGLLWDLSSCLCELHSDYVLCYCKYGVASIPTECQECFPLWEFKGGDLYKATSWVCCSRGEYCLQT